MHYERSTMLKLTWIVLAAQIVTVSLIAEEAPLTTLPVDSPAFVFSPGNWTGDEGRAGKEFRQTWNAGAYLRVAWETTNTHPTAKLLLGTSTNAHSAPTLAYNIDGVWKTGVPYANEIAITNLTGTGRHTLCVCLQSSEQANRWGSEGQSGLNVLRVTGLQVDPGSTPVPATAKPRWALIVGDSITEGIGAGPLASYAHLLGQALQTQDYEYGISACGWSGWLVKGDNPPGDVPGYYVVTNAQTGAGGQYDDAASRWNKIDGNRHSLLDAQGRLSAYGQSGQEPSLIVINYGTNDRLRNSDTNDLVASIGQCLEALRAGAPGAHIVLIIPFGQFHAPVIKEAVAAYAKHHPSDRKLAVIDLGLEVARSLTGVMGGLHPSDLGHANLAAKLIPQVMTILNERDH